MLGGGTVWGAAVVVVVEVVSTRAVVVSGLLGLWVRYCVDRTKGLDVTLLRGASVVCGLWVGLLFWNIPAAAIEGVVSSVRSEFGSTCPETRAQVCK